MTTAGAFDLKEFLTMLWRRRVVGIVILMMVLLGTTLYLIRAPRVYRAEALVLIEQSAPQVLTGMREVYDLGNSGYWASQEYYATQYAVIVSRPVMHLAIASLGIAIDDLRWAVRNAKSGTTEGLSAAIQDQLALIWLTEIDDLAMLDKRIKKWDPALELQKRIEVSPIRDSRLVHIAIEDTQPKRAAAWANAVADAYAEANLEQKIFATGAAGQWLSDRTQELREQLEEAEKALLNFKINNHIVSASLKDRQSLIAATLMQLNTSLSATRTARIALESQMKQVQGIQSGQHDATLAEIIDNRLVQVLKTKHTEMKEEEDDLLGRYTDHHPKVIAVRRKRATIERDLNAEIAKVLESITRKFSAAKETESSLQREMKQVTVEALELNRKEIGYNRLMRDRDNSKELYSLLLRRHAETNLTQMLRVNNIRKVEAALPPRYPVRPRILLSVFVALLFGALAAVAGVVTADHLDNSLKSREQVTDVLGLAFLGMVPAIIGSQDSDEPGGRDRYILENPKSGIAECCRTVRTNLMFMSPEHPTRTLLVTSSGPREGKSTTAISLATTMAQSGAKTVIVDTDMRRPRVHKSFGLNADVGITSLIVGESTLEKAVHATDLENLYVLTCGPLPPNPAELLHTDRFRSLIEKLCQQYERIIFDSPPVSAVTDPLILGSMVDGVVLVAHGGKTSIHAVQQAKRQLQDVGARIFGVVLNNIDLRQNQYAGYYQYYNYDYSSHGDAKGTHQVKA